MIARTINATGTQARINPAFELCVLRATRIPEQD